MITYRAMYKFFPDGVHAEVLDFLGVMTCADDLQTARRLLNSALQDMAEVAMTAGKSLPTPNASVTSAESDLEEPIALLISADN